MLVVERKIQLIAGASSYGAYISLFSLSFMLYPILDMGLYTYITQKVAVQEKNMESLFAPFFTIKIILASIYVLVIGVVGYFSNFPIDYWSLLWILVCNQIILSFIQYGRAHVVGLGWFRLDSFLSIADKLFLIISCIGLIIYYQNSSLFSIKWFALAQTISLCIAFCCTYFPLLQKVQNTSLAAFFKINFSWIKSVYPYALLVFFMSVYSKIDGFLIERLLPNGAAEAGIYAASYRIYDALNNLFVLFGLFMLPILSKIKNEKEETALFIDQVLKVLWVLVFAAMLFVFLNYNWIMQTLYHKAEYAQQNMGILIFALLGNVLVYVFGTLLTAHERIYTLNKIVFSGMLFNVILNSILIPRLGILGAVYAALATQLIMGFLHTIVAYKILEIPFHISVWIRLVVGAIGFSGALFFLQSYFELSIYTSIVGISFCALLFAFFVQLLSKNTLNSLKTYLKNR